MNVNLYLILISTVQKVQTENDGEELQLKKFVVHLDGDEGEPDKTLNKPGMLPLVKIYTLKFNFLVLMVMPQQSVLLPTKSNMGSRFFFKFQKSIFECQLIQTGT